MIFSAKLWMYLGIMHIIIKYPFPLPIRYLFHPVGKTESDCSCSATNVNQGGLLLETSSIPDTAVQHLGTRTVHLEEGLFIPGKKKLYLKPYLRNFHTNGGVKNDTISKEDVHWR